MSPLPPGGPFDIVGLDAASEAVYRLVLSRPSVDPADAASTLGVEPAEVRRSLEQLRTHGLISRAAERDSYSAVDPRVAIRALTERAADRLDALRAAIPAFSDSFAALSDVTEASPQLRVLDGAAQIGAWYYRIEHEVSEEFLAFDRPPYVAAQSNPVEPIALERGVGWRAIYAAESLERPGAWDDIREAVRAGEQSRIAAHLPVKLAIADRRIAIVSTTLDPAHPAALLVQSPSLVELLCDVFESHWERASAVPAAGQVLDPSPAGASASDEERAMLALFSAGVKDEVIARELGMSARTLRRRSAELLRRLGATNRFQAGVEAARRGWV